jgi:hypothetical protein
MDGLHSGDRVRISFEGVFDEYGSAEEEFLLGKALVFKDGSVFAAGAINPGPTLTVELVGREFHSGDVAEYSIPNGSRTSVIRMIYVDPGSVEPYWFDSEGNRWPLHDVNLNRLRVVSPAPS